MTDATLEGLRITTVTTTTRPKRVAFVFDPEHTSAEAADAAIDYCVRTWGGGYFPLVALIDGSIPDAWFHLLKAVDPDVVYALSDIPNEELDRIHRHVAPGRIREHTNRDRDPNAGPSFVDETSIRAIGVEDIPRHFASSRFQWPDQRFLLLDDDRNARDRDFVLRNFGLSSPTVSARRAFEHVPHSVTSISVGAAGLLQELTDSGRTYLPRDVSLLYASVPFSRAYDRWWEKFQLVIGDSVLDVAYAWNCPLMTEDPRNRAVLWVPVRLLDEPGFWDVAGNWIRRSFWHQHQRGGVVVSYSVELEQLREVAAKIHETAQLPFEARRFTPPEYPLGQLRSGGRRRIFGPSAPQKTSLVSVLNGRGLLSYAPPPFPLDPAVQGEWMCDLDIEYKLDSPRYANHTDSWTLPRRRALGKLFAANHGGLARVNALNFPSVGVAAGQGPIELRIPSKRAVLYKIFEREAPRESSALSTGQFGYAEVSEQGRRLRGLVELFGGIMDAGQIFNDGFWRQTFLDLSGRSEDSVPEQASEIQEILEEHYESRAQEVADHPQIARAIAKRLFRRRRLIRTTTLKMLKDSFARRQAAATQPSEHFNDFQIHTLDLFLESGVLLHGIEARCTHCGTRDFWRIDTLASRLRCRGCLRMFQVRANPTWRFMLNHLVANALAREGVLALLHAVYHLAQPARDCFIPILPHDLYENFDGPPFTDLDIIVIRDGRLIVGEVKSHPTGFEETDFDRLAEVAEAILPALVVVAAPGDDWPDDVLEMVDRLEQRLALSGVIVERCPLEWRD